MSDSVIYDNIFEAIRALDPQNIVLEALNGRMGGVILHQHYQILSLQNGKYGLFLSGLYSHYFRGEPQVYEHCTPSLFRIATADDRLIAQLKAIDFMMVLETHPEIQAREADGQYIDYLALAQHYGFATNMLDLTNEILTAAYFATHVNDPYLKKMAIAAQGIGQLRWTVEFPEPVGRLRMIGLQPLARPGLQSAYGMVLSEHEDFADMSSALKFRQNPKMNQLFHQLFLQGEELYFPAEEINLAADTIKNSNAVTSMAIQRYCDEYHIDTGTVRASVSNAGAFIVDAPLVCLNMPFLV